MGHRNRQYDWDGAGDRRRQQEDDDYDWDDVLIAETPTCSKRKLFINGLPVPVFPREEDENGNDEEETRLSFHDCQHLPRQERHPPPTTRKGSKPSTTGKKSLEDLVEEYIRCPICLTPCIEATSINCGHKFCKGCLEKWRKEKPVCPICSAYITSTHRMYCFDQFVESQLDKELKGEYLSTQKKRLEALMKEKTSWNVMKIFRRKLGNSVTYVRSKSRATIRDRCEDFYESTCEWVKDCNFGWLSGVLLGGILFATYNWTMKKLNFHFLQHIWLAAVNYNGTSSLESVVTPVVVEDEFESSSLAALIDALYPF